MREKFKKFVLVAAASALALSRFAFPAYAATPNWDVTGVYTIGFDCTPSCAGPYVHDASLTQTGSSVSGSGGYPAGGSYSYHWIITSGSVSGDSISLVMDYDTGAPGTTMTMTGTIAPNGSMSGTWTDNYGGTRNGTWNTVTGNAASTIPAQCMGMTFDNIIEGTNGANNINGTSGNDLILAKGGADRVNGMGGNDCIVGGDGADVLYGNDDNDVLLGGDGADALYGNAGMDKLYGGSGADNLYGGTGNDTLEGGANADRAFGDADTDTCSAEVKTSCEL